MPTLAPAVPSSAPLARSESSSRRARPRTAPAKASDVEARAAEPSESALLARLRAGDEAAYEVLVRTYGPRLLVVARSYQQYAERSKKKKKLTQNYVLLKDNAQAARQIQYVVSKAQSSRMPQTRRLRAAGGPPGSALSASRRDRRVRPFPTLISKASARRLAVAASASVAPRLTVIRRSAVSRS